MTNIAAAMASKLINTDAETAVEADVNEIVALLLELTGLTAM